MLHCTLHLGRKAHFDGVKYPNATDSAADFTAKAVFPFYAQRLAQY